ncbi:hypothetical protein BDZ94DRAFT_232746 [Collybia nuda]|uniref:Protein kinase domain-containing protein n=1 Tax=Collybia nuda TaxID=64659 RepID=A0A9P5XVC6_9AGAR|nr:hypothetical protein BDZ94DRAFT_232746 [Collybia nuda]
MISEIPLDTQKTGPTPNGTHRLATDLGASLYGVRELPTMQEEQECGGENTKVLFPARKMEEEATHMLEQMTEFIKIAVGGDVRPLRFDVSDPLDQILKGFSDSGGVSGDGIGIGNGECDEEGEASWGVSNASDKVSYDNGSGMKPYWSCNIVESNGAAFLLVHRAISGENSKINWYLSPNVDESVSSVMDWIKATEYLLGEFGLRKYLHYGKRGALFTNVDYRLEQNLRQPAFDWITFDDLPQPGDNIIRDSVASYDPALEVIIFIVLPLDMDNSIAIWERKIKPPKSMQFLLQTEHKIATDELWDQKAEIYDFSEVKRMKRRERGPLDAPPEEPQSSEVPTFTNELYQNLCNLIRQEMIVSPDRKGIDRIQETLEQASNSLRSLNEILALSHSHQFRVQLIELCSDLKILDSSPVRQALQRDEEHIFLQLQRTVSTKGSIRKAVLDLKGNDAENFMDLLQMTLDRYQNDPGFWRGARHLLVKLSEASGIIPASLSIQGVTLLERDAIFGGGFADIYRASYKDKQVALKRMRIFQRGQELHEIHRTFCKEALIWQSLRHPHVLPFLGVDSDTFSPYLCMVSPWMQHGTIMRHLSENKGVDVNKLLWEVAQGLHYLHSQKVVHGDLRGGNILINDEWQACLADFGLTVVSETTLATQTSNGHGSMRWMAPELHDPEFFGFNRFLRTPASDIYAFGCVCLEVCPRNFRRLSRIQGTLIRCIQIELHLQMSPMTVQSCYRF